MVTDMARLEWERAADRIATSGGPGRGLGEGGARARAEPPVTDLRCDADEAGTPGDRIQSFGYHKNYAYQGHLVIRSTRRQGRFRGTCAPPAAPPVYGSSTRGMPTGRRDAPLGPGRPGSRWASVGRARRRRLQPLEAAALAATGADITRPAEGPHQGWVVGRAPGLHCGTCGSEFCALFRVHGGESRPAHGHQTRAVQGGRNRPWKGADDRVSWPRTDHQHRHPGQGHPDAPSIFRMPATRIERSER